MRSKWTLHCRNIAYFHSSIHFTHLFICSHTCCVGSLEEGSCLTLSPTVIFPCSVLTVVQLCPLINIFSLACKNTSWNEQMILKIKMTGEERLNKLVLCSAVMASLHLKIIFRYTCMHLILTSKMDFGVS